MSSFVSTQFLVLNVDGLFDSSFNKFVFFGIPLLYYCTIINFSVVCYFSLRDMNLFNVNINASIISKNMHPF